MYGELRSPVSPVVWDGRQWVLLDWSVWGLQGKDWYFKAAVLQMLKKMKIIIKLTVNTDEVMFSGEIYYY